MLPAHVKAAMPSWIEPGRDGPDLKRLLLKPGDYLGLFGPLPPAPTPSCWHAYCALGRGNSTVFVSGRVMRRSLEPGHAAQPLSGLLSHKEVYNIAIKTWEILAGLSANVRFRHPGGFSGLSGAL